MNKPKRPTSPARAEAARRNGALSRGPATPQGRLNIAASNTRHGFFARALVLNSEDPAAFDELTRSLIARFAPACPYELRLVRTIAACAWRLERLYEIQTADLEHAIDRQAPTLDRDYSTMDPETRTALAFRELPAAAYSRYETTLILQQRRAIDLLARLRTLPDNSLIPYDRLQPVDSKDTPDGTDARPPKAA